jgi:hypothetical protein
MCSEENKQSGLGTYRVVLLRGRPVRRRATGRYRVRFYEAAEQGQRTEEVRRASRTVRVVGCGGGGEDSSGAFLRPEVPGATPPGRLSAREILSPLPADTPQPVTTIRPVFFGLIRDRLDLASVDECWATLVQNWYTMATLQAPAVPGSE